MQKIVYDNFYYTQLVNEQAIDAHAKSVDGLLPRAERVLEALLHRRRAQA